MSNKAINHLTCAMTVDVEDYFHVAAFAENIAPENWKNYPSRVVNNTRILLDLFDKNDIKATFFVLGWVAEREPELIKDIHLHGHEIASHGYSHELVYKQTERIFENETRRSKQILEDIINKPVTGYRASSYSITQKSLWALEILADLGFLWDSSIFPIHHDKYGITNSPTIPYEIVTQSGKTLKEIPMTTAPFCGLRLPAAGGGYFRLFPYWLSRYLLEKAGKNAPTVFYLHPWEIDPHQPRIDSASLLSRFRHYNNLDKCLPRLKQLINDFSLTTLSTALNNYSYSISLKVQNL